LHSLKTSIAELIKEHFCRKIGCGVISQISGKIPISK